HRQYTTPAAPTRTPTPYTTLFRSTPNDDIGFVTRVYQGVKENGAIFSHPNPWAWVAEAKLGRGDRAMELYDSLNPYNQNDIIERSEEHTSELQSRENLVCRLLLEK